MKTIKTSIYIVDPEYGPDMAECMPWDYNDLCKRMNLPLVNLAYGEDSDGFGLWYDTDQDDMPIVLAELPVDYVE